MPGMYVCTVNIYTQRELHVHRLVEHLPSMQNVVSLSPTQGSSFSLKMTVSGEVYCFVSLVV